MPEHVLQLGCTVKRRTTVWEKEEKDIVLGVTTISRRQDNLSLINILCCYRKLPGAALVSN